MLLRFTVLTLSLFMCGMQLVAMNEDHLGPHTSHISVGLKVSSLTEDSCPFCNLVKGERTTSDGRKLHVFYETNSHMAWLDNNPNTTGASLLIPKKHLPSNFENVPPQDLADTMSVAQFVSKMLNAQLETDRTALMIVGFQVPHFHIRLYPTKHPGKEKCIVSNARGEPGNDTALDDLASALRNKLSL